MTLSRSQYRAKGDRLLKKIRTCTIKDELSMWALEVAKSTLEFFMPDNEDTGSAESSSFSPPNTAEVGFYIKDMLSAPSEIFTEKFFRNPLFAFVTLWEVAELFGCSSIANDYMQYLNLTRHQKNDKRVMLHVWLVQFLGCNVDFCQQVLQKYEAGRGSLNPASFLLNSANENNDHSNSLNEADHNHETGRTGEESNVQDARATPNQPNRGAEGRVLESNRAHRSAEAMASPRGSMEPARNSPVSHPGTRFEHTDDSKKSNYVQ